MDTKSIVVLCGALLAAAAPCRATPSQRRLGAATLEIGALGSARTSESVRGVGDDVQRVLEGGASSFGADAVNAAWDRSSRRAPALLAPADQGPAAEPPLPPQASPSAAFGRGVGTVVGALPGAFGGIVAAVPQLAILNAAIASHTLFVLGGAGIITGALGLTAAVVGGLALAYIGAKYGGKAGAAIGGAIGALRGLFGRR